MALPPGRTEAPRRRTILLYASEDAMLEELAKATGLSCSAVIRNQIRSAFDMRFRRVPACATSSPCLCPGLHQNLQHSYSPVEKLAPANPGGYPAPAATELNDGTRP